MAEHADWHLAGTEPSLEDVLSDPIVLTLMRRDGVEAAALCALLDDAARRLSQAGEARQPICKVA